MKSFTSVFATSQSKAFIREISSETSRNSKMVNAKVVEYVPLFKKIVRTKEEEEEFYDNYH